MTNLTKLFASLMLVLGLVSIAGAASDSPTANDFAIDQSDTDDGEKKKVEGDEEGDEEEEESDCE